MTTFSRTTFQPVDLLVKTRAQLEVAVDAANTPPLLMRYAGFTVPDYLIAQGIPVAPPKTSVLVPTQAYITELQSSATAVPPEDVVTTATSRWLPHKGWTTARDRWNPWQGTSELWWNPGNGPLSSLSRVKTDYAYEGTYGAVQSRPALLFNQDSYLTLHGAGPNGPFGASPREGTVAFVACMQGATNRYGVICSNQEGKSAGQGLPFSLNYNKGLFEVRAVGRMAAYETSATAVRPMIVILSLNLGVTKGRICVLDGDRRFTREISTNGFEEIDFDLFFGASMHLYAQYADDTAANMDVLEIAIWNQSLNQRQIDQYLSKVAPSYGLVA